MWLRNSKPTESSSKYLSFLLQVVIRRELDCINSFTLEASFSGADFGPNRGYHFHQQHYMNIGKSFSECLLDYCDDEQSMSRLALEELRLLYPLKESSNPNSEQDDGGR